MSNKAMFDFKCEHCNKTHERYVYSDLLESFCGCGHMAKKVISAPSYLKVDGFRTDIYTEKWAKTREANARRNRED